MKKKISANQRCPPFSVFVNGREYLDIKERMFTQLLNTVKEISTVNITQSAKPRPIFTSENENKADNISDIKTNQSEREREASMTI